MCALKGCSAKGHLLIDAFLPPDVHVFPTRDEPLFWCEQHVQDAADRYTQMKRCDPAEEWVWRRNGYLFPRQWWNATAADVAASIAMSSLSDICERYRHHINLRQQFQASLRPGINSTGHDIHLRRLIHGVRIVERWANGEMQTLFDIFKETQRRLNAGISYARERACRAQRYDNVRSARRWNRKLRDLEWQMHVELSNEIVELEAHFNPDYPE